MELPEPLEYSEVIEIYEDILKKNPHSTIFVPLAHAYLKTENPERAIEILTERLSAYPDYTSARMALAEAYYTTERMDDAKKECLSVLTSNPDNLSAYKLLINIFLAENNKEEADKLIEKLKDLDPDDTRIQEFISSLEASLQKPPAQEKPEEIKREAFEEAEEEPGEPGEGQEEEKPKKDISTKTLAQIYEKQGLISRALETYKKILEDDPENELIVEKIIELEARLDAEELEEETEDTEDEEKRDEALKDVIGDKEAIQEIRDLFPEEEGEEIPLPEEEEKEEPSLSEEAPKEDKKVVDVLEDWLKNIESKKDES